MSDVLFGEGSWPVANSPYEVKHFWEFNPLRLKRASVFLCLLRNTPDLMATAADVTIGKPILTLERYPQERSSLHRRDVRNLSGVSRPRLSSLSGPTDIDHSVM